MRRLAFFLGAVVFLLGGSLLQATIFGKIQGIVHDPQHRPVSGATVLLQAVTSDWSQTSKSDDNGEFTFTAVPVGDYKITVTQAKFQTVEQTLTVTSGSSPVLHFQLAIASVTQTTVVAGEAPVVNMDSVTPTTLVDRLDIAQTPGADRTNGLQMITDYVPGSYVTHDMLHMRGGHQVEWLIDGVPIPNTNIATNLGPQIDPKDIDYLEVQRGSYDASYGDRTYGIFNIVPRTGFESNNEGELVTTIGNWFQTNDQLNFAGHTQRFAYYASINANRSNYGLQPPVGQVFHDAENGYGGFTSLIFNPSPDNQFRIVGSLRQDFYQIPYDPDPNSYGNIAYPSYGLRDSEREPDGYVTVSWVHTFNPNLLLTVSPFYHYNKASYDASPNDMPVISDVTQTSNYGGLQTSVNAHVWKNDISVGIYGFAQHQSEYFNNVFNPCVSPCSNTGPSTGAITGGLEEFYVDDKFKVTSWLTLIVGFRQSHFTADIVEDHVYPRYGVAIRVPRLNWVFHGFWGDFYQAPPLLTATGPLARLGERPEPHVWPSTRRARPRISVGCHDSVSRLVSRRRHLPNLRTQLAGSQQYWGIQHLLADYLGQGFDSSLGTHTAFPAPVESRPISSGLFQPNRASQRTDYRGPHLPSQQPAMPTPYITWIFAGGSRPEKHAQRRLQCRSSLAIVRLNQCVLRLGIHQRHAGQPVPRQLPAAAHHVRYFSRQDLRRKIHSLVHRSQRSQPSCAAG